MTEKLILKKGELYRLRGNGVSVTYSFHSVHKGQMVVLMFDTIMMCTNDLGTRWLSTDINGEPADFFIFNQRFDLIVPCQQTT